MRIRGGLEGALRFSDVIGSKSTGDSVKIEISQAALQGNQFDASDKEANVLLVLGFTSLSNEKRQKRQPQSITWRR